MQSWKEIIESEMKEEYYKNIVSSIKADKENHKIYPNDKDIFNAFKYCSFENIKICILGMDPYINENEAHGLAFSVNKGIKIPPSLRNIFKELKDDLNIDPPNHGCLIDWAKQGVLLLNSALTVKAKTSGSHMKIGWQTFTDDIIKKINELDRPIVFILWGAFAKEKKYLINNPHHLILEAAHPSFYSCKNFFGCKHFSKTNEFLIKNNIAPIDWTIK